MAMKILSLVLTVLTVTKLSANDFLYVDELLATKKYKKAYSYVSDPDKMGQSDLSASAMLFCKAKVYDEIYKSRTHIKDVSPRHIATASMRMYNKILSDLIHQAYHQASKERKIKLIDLYKEDIRLELKKMSIPEVNSLIEELVEIEPEGHILAFAGKCADFCGDYKSAGFYYVSAIEKEKQDLKVYYRVLELNDIGFIHRDKYIVFMEKAAVDYEDSDRIMKEKLNYMKATGNESFDEYEYTYKKILETDPDNIRALEILVSLYAEESDRMQLSGELEKAKLLLEKANAYIEFGKRFENVAYVDKTELNRLAREVSARYEVVTKQ